MIKYFLRNRSNRPQTNIVVELGKTDDVSALYDKACSLRGVTPSVKILDYLLELEYKPTTNGWFLLPDENIAEYGETGHCTVTPGVDYSYLSQLPVDACFEFNVFSTTNSVIISDRITDEFNKLVFQIPDTHFLYEEMLLESNAVPAETLELAVRDTDDLFVRLTLSGLKYDALIHVTGRANVEAKMQHIIDQTKVAPNWWDSKQVRSSSYVTIL